MGASGPGPLPPHCPLQGLLPAPVLADEDTWLRGAGGAGLTEGFSVSSATYGDAETEVQGVCGAMATDAAGWWPQPRRALGAPAGEDGQATARGEGPLCPRR